MNRDAAGRFEKWWTLGRSCTVSSAVVVETMVAIRRVKGRYIVRSTKVFRAACRVDTARFLLAPWNLHSSRTSMRVEIFMYIYYILFGYTYSSYTQVFSVLSVLFAVPPPSSFSSSPGSARIFQPWRITGEFTRANLCHLPLLSSPRSVCQFRVHSFFSLESWWPISKVRLCKTSGIALPRTCV